MDEIFRNPLLLHPFLRQTAFLFQLVAFVSILLLYSSYNTVHRWEFDELDLSEGNEGWDSLKYCDLYDGEWAYNHTLPIYDASCPFIDETYNCMKRPDKEYASLSWQPHGCTLPGIDGKKMLQMLKGKRIVFVGDSLNNNMWASLVCICRASLEHKDRVFEVPNWHQHTIHKGFRVVHFIEYNCSIEYHRHPFLVQQGESFVRLDLIPQSAKNYKAADIIIFNSGHWWTDANTKKGKEFFVEGDHVYSQLGQMDAFLKAMKTWSKWVDFSIDAAQTKVFFLGYSSSHYMGGHGSSGGRCDTERYPVTNGSLLGAYPRMMSAFDSIISQMKTPIIYLNITAMTDPRKDGHPSVYTKPKAMRKRGDVQDCIHWCLPGVPDAWNELLYAILYIDARTAMEEDLGLEK